MHSVCSTELLALSETPGLTYAANFWDAIAPRMVWCALLSLALAASLPVHAQQLDPLPPQTSSYRALPQVQLPTANPSPPAEESDDEPNPAAAVEPASVTTTDSLGNIRQQINLQGDFAVADTVRLGLQFDQGFIYNNLPKSSGTTEEIQDVGVTSQWHPNEVVKFDAMFGVSQMGATTNPDGQSVPQAVIPVTKLQLHLTPPGGILKLDLGFKRFIFDLSPQLVANRAVRNDFVVHPEISLPSGWRLRALAEMGPVTSTGESNARYNSEFTVGHKLGKESELYSTYSMLHYAQPSNAGYFSPDLVQNIEGGWSTDVDRKALCLSLDFGLGAGHARQHGGDTFGPWGMSAHTGSFLTWTVRPGREVRASYEYYYDQSNPALESAPAGPWHMSVITLAFRWSAR